MQVLLRLFSTLLSLLLALTAAFADDSCPDNEAMLQGHRRINGNPLTPADLPPVLLYSDWSNHTVVVEATGEVLTVATGSIKQAGDVDFKSDFDALVHLASREEVDRMLELLNDPALQSDLDRDPDTVDGFATQEFFLDNMELRQGLAGKPQIESDEQVARRKSLREALLNITLPILNDRLTPYVNQRFPKACQNKGPGRSCTPCYSLIRRYIEGERQSHAPHRDGHAIVTAVVSLSDYGTDYRGGLYVASESGRPYFMALNKGDAAVHQSDLQHGVKVYKGDVKNVHGGYAQRWSWILWFRDSETCDDHGQEWFVDCAEAGNPTCEMLYSTKVGNIPGISKEREAQEVLKWNNRAALHGHATACVKLARAYLGKLPSALPYDPKKARKLFRRAIRSSNDPDAHYGIASMLLEELSKNHERGLPTDHATLMQAVAHLEASAMGGHPFAMFNLGLANLFGYGSERNPALAAEWFETSGLPEGLAARSMYYTMTGQTKLADEFRRRATSLGYGTQWRVMARQYTGYGGAGGIDLNLSWPPNENNEIPPKW